MTEDVTHGLTLLADEAEPAPVDTYAVIAKARTRNRNRRTMATAFASVVAIGVLATTLSTDRWTDTATAQELRSARLTAQWAAMQPELLPAGWTPEEVSPNVRPRPGMFKCGDEPPLKFEMQPGDTEPPAIIEIQTPQGMCSTGNWYQDEEGVVVLQLIISAELAWPADPCAAPECEESTLADGTRVWVRPDTASAAGPLQLMDAFRPDGTHVKVSVHWRSEERSTPPMTRDELVKLADVFSY
jgi:hypothetical protein